MDPKIIQGKRNKTTKLIHGKCQEEMKKDSKDYTRKRN